MKRLLRMSVILIILLSAAFCFAASQTTSSTTAASLIDRAEVFLNDSDNRFWTAAELLQWLNSGMIDIATRSQCLQSTASISLVADQLEYSLSSYSYLAIKGVMYTDANSAYIGLKRANPNDVGRVPESWEDASKRNPTYYYEWGGSLGVFPVKASVTTETVTIYYAERPATITSTDNVLTPAEYDTALVYYMVAQAWMKDLKLNKYLQTMALYNSEMTRIRQDLNEFPPSVTAK